MRTTTEYGVEFGYPRADGTMGWFLQKGYPFESCPEHCREAMKRNWIVNTYNRPWRVTKITTTYEPIEVEVAN